MEHLGDAVKKLLRARNLNGAELAKRIGISATSLSRIVQGHSKPRQVTFTRLCKELALTSQDKQLLVRWFTGVGDDLPDEKNDPSPENEAFERQRAERFLEIKTQSISFKRSVARELDKVGIPYRQDYCEGVCVTDFLIERNDQRIAFECKFNVHRDFEKTISIAQILRSKMHCSQVFVVVPYDHDEQGGSYSLPAWLKIIALAQIGCELPR